MPAGRVHLRFRCESPGPDGSDHGRRRGHAHALGRAQGPARGLRATDDRLAHPRRPRGRRGPDLRDRLARSRPLRRSSPRGPRRSSSPWPTAPAAPCARPPTWSATPTLSWSSPATRRCSAPRSSRACSPHTRRPSAAATMMTTELEDPGTFGRVIRDRGRRGRADRRGEEARRRHRRAARGQGGERRHLRLRRRAARRGPRRSDQRQRPGRVLPARRAAADPRGRRQGDRAPGRGPGGQPRGQRPRRPRPRHRRGASPDPRSPTCAPASRSRIPASTWIDADVEHRARTRPSCPGTSLRGSTSIGVGQHRRADDAR